MAKPARSRACSPRCSSADRPRPHWIARATRSRRDRACPQRRAAIGCRSTAIAAVRRRVSLDPAQGPAGAAGAGLGGSGFGGPPPAAGNAAGAGAGTGLGGLADSGSSSAGGGKPVLQGVRITADTVNNTLLIYADQENYRIIQSTLQQVDQPQLQVAIDATIAEVTLTDELAYGVQAYLKSHNLGLGTDKGSILNTQATAAPTPTSTTSTTG